MIIKENETNTPITSTIVCLKHQLTQLVSKSKFNYVSLTLPSFVDLNYEEEHTTNEIQY